MGQSSPIGSSAADDGPDIGVEAHRTDGRHYDAARFPELDCLRGVLPPETLAAAALRADALGIGAERVLIAYGVLTEDAYLQRLSVRSGIRLADFSKIGRRDLDLTDEQLRRAALTGVFHVRIDGEDVLIGSLRKYTARKLARTAAASPREARHWRLTTDKALQDFLLYRTRAFIDHAIDDLQDRFPSLSAAPGTFRSWFARAVRGIVLSFAAVALLACIVAVPGAAGNLLALLFLAAIALRLVASVLRAPATPPAPHISDRDLPVYSVIVALYREAASIPQLLAGLGALDYPREKLDILLVVETDDLATRAAIARERPPSFVRVIVAPDEGPRTKPKALNVALPFARGTFVAVYDAEDRPDPDQLRVALAAFQTGDDDLVCVQARLAIENSGDSLFTRMFAAEYAGQFDITMRGYDYLGLPWPLGGTSNHFHAASLREVAAWDPYNVTEDADLGLRFARFGYSTATIASTTWEEAPLTFRAWLHQRTRWMKGWMQTWWVHSRHPRRFWRRTRWQGLVARDLIIGGALIAALAYPFLVIVGLLMAGEYLVTGELANTATLLSPLHLASIVSGLGVSVLIQLRGLAHRGRLKHAWVLALTPIYWACLSTAAWRALLQLRSNPYHWEKTEHGLAKSPALAKEAVAHPLRPLRASA